MLPSQDPAQNPETPSRRGGSRPGAGRKLDGYVVKRQGDVNYARALLRAVMRDDSLPLELRAQCALAVLQSRNQSRGDGHKSNPTSD